MREKPPKRTRVNAAVCLKCGDVIWSRWGHDFRGCTCKSVSIDGGRGYTRYVGKPEDYHRISLLLPIYAMDSPRSK